MTKRLVRLADDLSAQPTKSIPVACAGPAEVKAAYRLLDNEALDWRAVLEAHGQPTAERMGGKRGRCASRTRRSWTLPARRGSRGGGG